MKALGNTVLVLLFCGLTGILDAQEALSAADLLSLRTAGNIQVSPDGSELIYSVSTPRGPNEEAGPSHTAYFRMKLTAGVGEEALPLFPEGIRGTSPRYSPDGSMIAFIRSTEKDGRQVWAMPAGGGEVRQLTSATGGISDFRWQPGHRGMAYLEEAAETEREKELERRGYGFIFYEENLKDLNLWIASFDEDWGLSSTKQLTEEVMCWDFEFNAQGTQIAASISPENLIDQKYMMRRIHVIDPHSGERRQVSENEGKLGNYAFSPDGKHLAYAAALDINDHAVSQAFIVDLGSGEVNNLTPDKFRGHISWVGWKDNKNILTWSGEGVYPRLSTFPLGGGKRKILLDAAENGIVFGAPCFDHEMEQWVFSGSTPFDRENLYSWDGKGELRRLTDLNPVLEERKLGRQEVIRYAARDGLEIEGLVIHPVDYQSGKTYPLVVYVHGGPESHHSNEWLSRYSTPGQVMAGKGYLVLYLNYRASTGYGVDFGMEGFGDPAGKEFDDIADAIDWMVEHKGADRERVGLAGGSYGGYASAWFATYYTAKVRAVCMFVGISNVISKRGTTDIPLEELYVHSGRPLEEMWQENLERSPVYWAHQSRTATLIYGGADDTRVHPSQSMELYRRMKVNGHPAVRLVQYPGEGHGNRKQVGQTDVLYRQMAWLDWYVRDLKPLDGPMPPLDISDSYGLDWEF